VETKSSSQNRPIPVRATLDYIKETGLSQVNRAYHMQVTSPDLSASAAYRQINATIPYSPLLTLLEQGNHPIGNDSIEFITAITREIEYSKRHFEAGRFPFLDFVNRCSTLPPEESLSLAVQFFIPLSKFSQEAESLEYREVLSVAISDLTISLGEASLKLHSDYSQVRAIAKQVRDLLNCELCRNIVVQALGHSTAESYEKGCLMTIATARANSELYGEAILYVRKQRGLNYLQSLNLTREVLNFCLYRYSSSNEEIRQLCETFPGLAVSFGYHGIESCKTVQDFEELARHVHEILDRIEGCRPNTIPLLGELPPKDHTPLLRAILENKGCRKAKFLEALVMHLPSHFFTTKEWDHIGFLCLTTYNECPVKLWMAAAAHSSRSDVILEAAKRVCHHLRSVNRAELDDNWSRSTLGQLIANIPESRQNSDAAFLKLLSGINPVNLVPTQKANSPPIPTFSLFLKYLNGEIAASDEQMSAAIRQEILMCRTHLSQGNLPFPALLEACHTLPGDTQVEMCTDFFNLLAKSVPVGSEEYNIVSKSVAQLAIHISNNVLNAQTDLTEIFSITYEIRRLLRCLGGRNAVTEILTNKIRTPASQLVFEIANIPPDSTSFHDNVVVCGCNLKGLRPISALQLSSHYLRSVSSDSSNQELSYTAAKLALVFGAPGIETCRNLREFEALATEVNFLLDSFDSARNKAYALWETHNLSTNNLIPTSQLLIHIIQGIRHADLVELLALHVDNNFFSTDDWDGIGRLCQILGSSSPRRLLIGAAVNGSQASLKQYVFTQFRDWGEQEIASIKGHAKSSHWLDRLVELPKLNYKK
jgi:hypothetical protein